MRLESSVTAEPFYAAFGCRVEKRGEHRIAPGVTMTAVTMRKRLSLEILHDEERRPVLFPDVVERADVRMIELGDRAGLAVESLADLPIGSNEAESTLIATTRSRRVSRVL